MSKMITVQEAATQLSIDPKLLYRLIAQGKAPFAAHVSAHTIRISQERLDTWLANGGMKTLDEMNPPPEGLLTAADVAKDLSLSEVAVNRLAKAGTLPSKMWGSTRVFDPNEMKAWEEKQFAAGDDLATQLDTEIPTLAFEPATGQGNGDRF